VVVSIIALLISILLPSLQKARAQAKAVVCSAQMRGLTQGLGSYTNDSNDWLPGLNTSGVRMRALQGSVSDADALRRPDVPVQPHDWATPLLAQDLKDMPNNRAERMRLVQERFRCPAQVGIKSVLYPFSSGSPADRADFEALGPWTALSMLMPVHFQYWGASYAGQKLGSWEAVPAVPVNAAVVPDGWEVSYDRYVSLISRVGNPSEKVFVADGTRYLAASGLLDHDISPIPTYFGSFTSSGGWWSGSTAYGVRAASPNWDGIQVGTGSPANGKNLGLSYRHRVARGAVGTDCRGNSGAINASFFDGHVQTLSDRASRNIRLWYPKGAKVEYNTAGMTNVPVGSIIP
jgi:prepilin-type processing-associated H-X9-DG protein